MITIQHPACNCRLTIHETYTSYYPCPVHSLPAARPDMLRVESALKRQARNLADARKETV